MKNIEISELESRLLHNMVTMELNAFYEGRGLNPVNLRNFTRKYMDKPEAKSGQAAKEYIDALYKFHDLFYVKDREMGESELKDVTPESAE